MKGKLHIQHVESLMNIYYPFRIEMSAEGLCGHVYVRNRGWRGVCWIS